MAIKNIAFLLSLITLIISGTPTASATVFNLENRCSYPVWPGTLTGNGAAALGGGGFKLAPGESTQIPAPPGWSGRFWGRTGCNFDDAGNGNCTTGDCGPLQCTGGGVPPVTLVEFTLGSNSNEKDFYDVSLVDGYNVGMGVRATGGSGDCQYAGCVTDLNANCPAELQVVSSGVVVACRSACATFNTPEFCCSGEHATPDTCGPTDYSRMFKAACPTAYSYTDIPAVIQIHKDSKSQGNVSGANDISEQEDDEKQAYFVEEPTEGPKEDLRVLGGKWASLSNPNKLSSLEAECQAQNLIRIRNEPSAPEPVLLGRSNPIRDIQLATVFNRLLTLKRNRDDDIPPRENELKKLKAGGAREVELENPTTSLVLYEEQKQQQIKESEDYILASITENRIQRRRKGKAQKSKKKNSEVLFPSVSTDSFARKLANIVAKGLQELNESTTSEVAVVAGPEQPQPPC